MTKIKSPTSGRHNTIAFSLTAPKTAALLFDRIIAPMEGEGKPPPYESEFNEIHSAIVNLYGTNSSLELLQNNIPADIAVPVDISVSDRLYSIFMLQSMRPLASQPGILPDDAGEDVRKKYQQGRSSIDKILSESLQGFCDFYREKLKLGPITIYSSQSIDEEFCEGNLATLVPIIDNLQIVDERELSWEKVSEFRKDERSRRSYHNLMHWLNGNMVGKSEAFIEDAISIKLEKYETALENHGIKTQLGCLTSLFDGKFFTASGVTSLATDKLMSEPLYGLLATGSLLIGKAAISIKTRSLKRREVDSAHSDIAYFHQMKEIGSNDKNSIQPLSTRRVVEGSE